jgi:hypothetical protein
MHTLRRGLLAGVLASLVLALFAFVTDGAPGNGFSAVLRWFGLLFGALQRGRLIATGRALLTGLALGVLWWLLFEWVLANLTNHAPSLFSLSFGQFLSSFPLAALFGFLLGAIFIQWQGHYASRQPS